MVPPIKKRTVYYAAPHRRHNSYDIYYEQDEGSQGMLKPVLIFVGGGGWQQSSRTGDHFNRHVDLATVWARLGYVVVVLRHRPAAISHAGTALVCTGAFLPVLFVALGPLALLLLLPSLVAFFLGCVGGIVMLNRCRGAAPFAQVVVDVARGIASVARDESQRLEAARADLSRIVLCGNSSGGQLISLLALDWRYLDGLGVPATSIRAVVDVSGVATLTAPLLLPVRTLLLIGLLGSDPAAARALSPLEHASRTDGLAPRPLFYLVTAQHELPTLRSLSRRLGEALARSGRAADTSHVLINGHLHFTAIRAISPVLEEVRQRVLASASRDAPARAVPAAPTATAASIAPTAPSTTTASAAADGTAAAAVAAAVIAAAIADDDGASTDIAAGSEAMCLMSVADSVFFLIGFIVIVAVDLGGTSAMPDAELCRLATEFSRTSPVLRARALRVGCRLYWLAEAAFEPTRHVATHRSHDLHAAVADEIGRGLPDDRPLWRLTQLILPEGRRFMLCMHDASSRALRLGTRAAYQYPSRPASRARCARAGSEHSDAPASKRLPAQRSAFAHIGHDRRTCSTPPTPPLRRALDVPTLLIGLPTPVRSHHSSRDWRWSVAGCGAATNRVPDPRWPGEA